MMNIMLPHDCELSRIKSVVCSVVVVLQKNAEQLRCSGAAWNLIGSVILGQGGLIGQKLDG